VTLTGLSDLLFVKITIEGIPGQDIPTKPTRKALAAVYGRFDKRPTRQNVFLKRGFRE